MISQVRANNEEQLLSFIEQVCVDNCYDFALFVSAWEGSITQQCLKLPQPGKGKPRKESGPEKPKKPRSAYIYFCQANRAATKESLPPGSKSTDVMVELGRQWSALKEDESREAELADYAQQAFVDKARYRAELDGYFLLRDTKDNLHSSPPGALPTRKKFTKRITGYDVYYRTQRERFQEENPKFKIGELVKTVAKAWKGLNKDGKREWQDLAVVEYAARLHA